MVDIIGRKTWKVTRKKREKLERKRTEKRVHLTEKDKIKCRKERQDRSMRNKYWRNIRKGKNIISECEGRNKVFWLIPGSDPTPN